MAIIKGTAGSDTLIGSSNNDWIEGYAGPDMLTGGGGGDAFAFTNVVNSGRYENGNYWVISDDGFDIITDFNDKEDTILSRSRPSPGIPGSSEIPAHYKPVAGVNIIPNENDFASTFVVLGPFDKFTDFRFTLDPFFVNDSINMANVFQPDLNIGQLNQSISLVN